MRIALEAAQRTAVLADSPARTWRSSMKGAGQTSTTEPKS